MKFKEYVAESLRKTQDGKIDFSIDSSLVKEPSSISTFQPNKLRSTADKSKTLGHRVFYAYSYQSSSEVTDILKSLKGKGSAFLDNIKLDVFLEKTAKYMASSLFGKYDVIIAPRSSSDLVKKFAYKMGKHLDVEVIYDAFDKFKIDLPSDKEESVKYVISNFIDLRAFESSFKSEDPVKKKESLENLAKSIIRSIKKVGKVELKNLYKPTAKYAANFLRPEVHTKHRLLEKRVLVVDDSFSSGGTMMEIFRQLGNSMGASEVSGAVIFMQKSK